MFGFTFLPHVHCIHCVFMFPRIGGCPSELNSTLGLISGSTKVLVLLYS